MSSPPQGAESHPTTRPYWIHRERISLVDPHPRGMPDRLSRVDPNRLYRPSSPIQQPASSPTQPEPAAPPEDHIPQRLREIFPPSVPTTLLDDTPLPRTNPGRTSRAGPTGLFQAYTTSTTTLPTFLAGNILPLLPSHPLYPTPGTICGICQDRFHAAHAPILIINTPHCVDHIFGYQCLRKSLASGMPNSNKCPLCRTKWFEIKRQGLEDLAEIWRGIEKEEERIIREEREAEAKVARRMRREEIEAANAWLGDVEPDDVDMTLMDMVMIVAWRYLYDISVWLLWLFKAACVIICVLEVWASREAFPFWRRLQEMFNVEQ